MHVRDLGAGLLEQVGAACRARVPSARGILVGGSYARGTASPVSDLDIWVFVDDSDDTEHYRTWLEARAGAPALHVSARTDMTLEAWVEEAEEPQDWSFGLPTAQPFEWLWELDGALRTELGERPVLRTPAGEPEVEDMVTELTKLHRAAASTDDLGIRFHAQRLIAFAAPTVVALNAPAPTVETPRAALETICRDLARTPNDWERDVLVCLGLTPADVSDTATAADRLVVGVLELLRTIDPTIDRQDGVADLVRTSDFERILDASRANGH